MNLEKQVCSLEYARRLKELGVKQASLVYWLNIQHCVHVKVKENGWEIEEDENGNAIIDRIDYRIQLGDPFACNIDKDNCWSAFTVAELGEMLPFNKPTPENDLHDLLILKHMSGDWIVGYRSQRVGNFVTQFNDESLANAMAKTLVYLIENSLYTPENKDDKS